jgi:hypothetical protein
MLNDFDGMTQERMMECAEILEKPLKLLEEETKAKEAADAEAFRLAAEAENVRKAQEAKKEADLRAAKKKAHDEAAAHDAAKMQEVMLMQDNLASCEKQLEGAVIASSAVAECTGKLESLEASSVAVDPRIKPLFGSRSLEVVVGPILLLCCVLFWLLGCCVERQRVVPMVNPLAGSSGVSISEVVIRPGNEVCVIKNFSSSDVVRNIERITS